MKTMETTKQRNKAVEIRKFFNEWTDTQIIDFLAQEIEETAQKAEEYERKLEKLEKKVKELSERAIRQYDEIRKLEDVNAKYARRHLNPIRQDAMPAHIIASQPLTGPILPIGKEKQNLVLTVSDTEAIERIDICFKHD